MNKTHLPDPYKSQANEHLVEYDAFIFGLARKRIPRNVVPSEILDDEIDELAQKIRIKFWLRSQKEQIKSPKAYITCIGRTESVDMVRRHKPTFSLSVNEDGELNQGKAMVTAGEGMQDPAEKLEREEMMVDYITNVVEDVLTLPPCQQRAMICELKDQLDDIRPLSNAFRRHKVNIETINWPEEKAELQKYRASLSIARKKLRALRHKYDS